MGIRIIDLSFPLQNFCYYPNLAEIVYWNHHEGTRRAGIPNSLNEDDFPEKMHLAIEKITLVSHSGTHMDAPYHYGPQEVGNLVSQAFSNKLLNRGIHFPCAMGIFGAVSGVARVAGVSVSQTPGAVGNACFTPMGA